MTSVVTCGACSGYGGRSGLEYVERRITFTAPDRGVCVNCGQDYTWSRSTIVRARRVF